MATIGLSKPYYAIYSNSGATVTYSGGGVLGKYTEISLSLSDGSDNAFYADDGMAENEPGFAGGTVTVSTDDLRPSIAQSILGLQATEIGITSLGTTTPVPAWLTFDDSQAAPFVGLGGILMKKVDGAIKYIGFVFNKIKFRNPSIAATTKGKEISWQVSELVADIARSDAAGAPWFKMSTLLNSREDAEAVVRAFLNIT